MLLNVKIKGFEQVGPMLKSLPKAMRNKVIKKTGNKVAKPVIGAMADAVLAAGLLDTGNLAQSFGSNSYTRKGKIFVSIGPVSYSKLTSKQRKKRRVYRSAFYMKFLELGTKKGNKLKARHVMQKVARRLSPQLIDDYVHWAGIFANEEIEKLKQK